MPRRVKPGSIGQYFEDGFWTGKLKEVHSTTCAHCSAMTEFPSMREMMNYVEICRNCMKLICLHCYDKRVCTPFMKKVEEQEEASEREKQRRRLKL